MVLMYTIAETKNKTTIYKKVPYDCLSFKQKTHLGINKMKYNYNSYINNSNSKENLGLNKKSKRKFV